MARFKCRRRAMKCQQSVLENILSNLRPSLISKESPNRWSPTPARIFPWPDPSGVGPRPYWNASISLTSRKKPTPDRVHHLFRVRIRERDIIVNRHFPGIHPLFLKGWTLASFLQSSSKCNTEPNPVIFVVFTYSGEFWWYGQLFAGPPYWSAKRSSLDQALGNKISYAYNYY